jgi:hypothetical protein
LVSSGRRGSAPDEFWLYRAAKILGCTPWELENQSVRWRELALMFATAENWAENERAEREKWQAGRSG